MLHRFGLVFSHILLVSGEVCNDDPMDVASALQVTQLHDRSVKRVATADTRAVELALSRKGNNVDDSTSRKRGPVSKTLAQLEQEIADFDAKVMDAASNFDVAKEALLTEMQGVVDSTGDAVDAAKQVASDGKQLVTDAARAALDSAEEKMQYLYDDVLVKQAQKLKSQLSRAKESAEEKASKLKDELDLKLEGARRELQQAQDNAKYAVGKAKETLDDLAAAAIEAGKELVQEAADLINKAVDTAKGLVAYPDEWATGNGVDGKCESAKRYRHDTGSEIAHFDIVSSKESCQEKCQENPACAYWVRYQLSRDCHLFKSDAVVKIDRSWSNTPFGGPRDCVIED